MLDKFKKISLGNWILIGMILGFIVGLILNFWVKDPFIKDIVLIDNVFYIGGTVFIKLMKMLVVPLVFCSIVVGVASISDIRKICKIGGTTILIYLLTTALAITIALLIAGIIKPGEGLNMAGLAQANLTATQSMADTLINIIPDNPINSLAAGDMLPVIIFGVLIGIILAKLREETKTVNKLFEEGNTIMMEMTSIVMKFAPIGVFCLMAKTFAGLGFGGLMPLLKYIGCVLLGLAIQAFIVYPSIMVILTRLNPIKFFKRFISVMFFAFSSSTSNATIPLNMEKLSEMGVSRDIDLGTSALITVVFTAVMASVGTAGVPSVGLITLNMVFNSVGLPVDAIGIIMGIDHLLDMFRTAVNVTGDAICTIIVSFRSKALDLDVFNGKKEIVKKEIDYFGD